MTEAHQRTLGIAVLIAVFFGAYFLRGYALMIVLAAIIAFIYNPSYQWFLRKTNNKEGISVALTMLFALVSIAIPLVIVLALTVNQALQFVDTVKATNIDSESIKQALVHIIDTIQRTTQNLPGVDTSNLNLDSTIAWLKDNIATFAKTVMNYSVVVVGSISTFFTKLIIFIFVLISLLKNQDYLKHVFTKLNPLGERASELYLDKISAMTKAMVKGQFIIALLQGIVDASLLWIVGADYFFFWLVLITFLSIIPLGGGIIILPAGIIMLVSGHFWQGLVLILGHILIVTNIDNVLRPRLVPKTARLDSALTILSVFAGLAMFGFLGIVIGPVIMIVIVTTIQAYIQLADIKTKAPARKVM